MLSAQIRCTVIETAGGPDELWRPQPRGFRELLPWADPYIAQLLLRHQMQTACDAAAANCEPASD
jgi:hypothetical protein